MDGWLPGWLLENRICVCADRLVVGPWAGEGSRGWMDEWLVGGIDGWLVQRLASETVFVGSVSG